MAKAWDIRVDRLCERLRELSQAVESSCPFGTEAADQGEWCEACAPEDANILTEADDSQRFCQACGKILDHLFTDWGVMEEIAAAAETSGPLTPAEALTLLNIIDSGVPRLTCKCGDFEYMPELKPQLKKIEARLLTTVPPSASDAREGGAAGAEAPGRTGADSLPSAR